MKPVLRLFPSLPRAIVFGSIGLHCQVQTGWCGVITTPLHHHLFSSLSPLAAAHTDYRCARRNTAPCPLLLRVRDSLLAFAATVIIVSSLSPLGSTYFTTHGPRSFSHFSIPSRRTRPHPTVLTTWRSHRPLRIRRHRCPRCCYGPWRLRYHRLRCRRWGAGTRCSSGRRAPAAHRRAPAT